jgi:hypothetical protein
MHTILSFAFVILAVMVIVRGFVPLVVMASIGTIAYHIYTFPH